MSNISLSFKKYILCSVLLFFAGCANYPDITQDWPDELPPLDFFVQAYEVDLVNQAEQSLEQYLTWVKRFYQGWVVYDNGWLEMSEDLVAKISDEPDALRAAEQIKKIGLLISPEWAKSKEDRYIHTSMVSVWGQSLLESLSRGELYTYMDHVEQDLAMLKNGDLGRESVSMERYFPDLASDDDFFF